MRKKLRSYEEAIRRRRRRVKLAMLFASVICGAICFAVERYAPFRLRAIDIVPAAVMPEAAVWEALPKSAESFWLSLFLDSREFTRRVENFYPVKLSLSSNGWGRCKVTVEPLEAFLTVSWNGKLWLLSKSGRMWLANLSTNAIVKGLRFPDRPILAWDSSLALPIDPEVQGGDIYASSLAIEKIERWYDAIDQTGWKDDIYCLIAKKVDGRPVVQVLFGTEGSITGELVLKEDTANWLHLAAAMRKIFPNAEYRSPPGMIINATYSDLSKFTVTNKRAK